MFDDNSLLLGIEIGFQSIKLIEIEKKNNKFALKSLGEISIPSGIVFSENKNDELVLAEKIKKLIKDTNCKSRTAVSVISSDQIITIAINLPLMTEKELAYAMKWELKKRITGYPDVVHVSWGIVNKDKDTEVLVVAVPKILASRYAKILRSGGLVPASLEIEPFSLTRAIASEGQGAIINIHIGYNFSTINLMVNGALRLSRYLKIGEDEMSKSLLEFGEKIKRDNNVHLQRTFNPNVSQAPKKDNSFIINPTLREIAAEFTMLTKYSQKNGKEISQVILSGDCAIIPHLPQYLGEILHKEIEIADPWTKINCAALPNTDQVQKIGPRFAVAIGLAMA